MIGTPPCCKTSKITFACTCRLLQASEAVLMNPVTKILGALRAIARHPVNHRRKLMAVLAMVLSKLLRAWYRETFALSSPTTPACSYRPGCGSWFCPARNGRMGQMIFPGIDARRPVL